jgi:hypothetical protein
VIIPENRSPLEPARHHMMERSWSIYAGTTWHDSALYNTPYMCLSRLLRVSIDKSTLRPHAPASPCPCTCSESHRLGFLDVEAVRCPRGSPCKS